MRWEICFNLSVLRMLSFALDLHWRRRQAAAASAPKRGSPGSRHQQQEQQPAAKSADGKGGPAAAALWRQQMPLPADADYGLLPYLAYVLYAPLYLAGPVITFQDFAWQLRQQAPPSARVVRFQPVKRRLFCAPACH